MPEAYHIRITPRSLADLQSIFRSIEIDSPQNASSMIRRILDDIDRLEILPHRYNVPRTGKVQGREIRSMPVRPYLIRYRIDEPRKAVHI